VAERLAAELGVDLAALSGTGPEGLITKHDVSRAAASKPAAVMAAPAMQADLTRMIVDLDIELLSWRRRIDEVTIAMSAFAARALALALGVRPELQALRSGAYGLTAALALGQRARPHLVVIREIEHKALPALGEELVQLERRARAGSLEPWRTGPAPIVIEDFAPYGIDVIAAVPAQAAGLTLALGRPRRVMAEVRDGFGFRTTMAVSLTAPTQLLSPHATADLLEAVALNLADPDALYMPVRPNRNPP
jgi:pyruvate dehydrogenase E2 component (dihydrolipoamide acetyltransferase)